MKKIKIKKIQCSLNGFNSYLNSNIKISEIEQAFEQMSEQIIAILNQGHSKRKVYGYLKEQGLDISYNTFNKYLKLHQSKFVPVVVQDVKFDEPQFEKKNVQWGGV